MKETSDVVDNFVDKPVDNKGITVENMWKRGIKALAPKRSKADSETRRRNFSFKPLKDKRIAKILMEKGRSFFPGAEIKISYPFSRLTG